MNDIYDEKQAKKFEFSKLIFLMLSGMASAVIIFSMLIMWRTGDTSPLTYLIPSVFGTFATGVGFYYDKSKKDNAIKLRKFYGDDLMDKVKQDI